MRNQFTENQTNWLNALDHSKKHTGWLCDIKGESFCCLGVGLGVLGFKVNNDDASEQAYMQRDHISLETTLRDGIYHEFNLRSFDGDFLRLFVVNGVSIFCLTQLNDLTPLLHKDIAELIREYPWNVFNNFDAPDPLPEHIKVTIVDNAIKTELIYQ